MLWKKFAEEDVVGSLAELGSSPQGLSEAEAKERLQSVGRNRIEEQRSFWKETLKRRAKSSFLYLLLSATALSFFLGDILEASLILVFVIINVSLETYQEYHSERTVRLLRRYLVTHATVRRGGRTVTVESDEVVPGDVVLVSVGDRLPADMRFLTARGLEADESVMTGESEAVPKGTDTLRLPPTEMHEATNVGFAGTIVTGGHGEGVVFATGKDTALGDIATLTNETRHETIFERDLSRFSRFILRLVILTLGLIFLANVLIKGDGTNLIELLIFSLALAVTVVPEALPVILTVALSRGSLRLAQKKVVVKRLSAIEDLGSIEVLCTDKTGTLTENMLTVRDVYGKDKNKAIGLALSAALQEPTSRENLHDAFDLSLWQAALSGDRSRIARMKRLENIPFDPERRRNSVFLQGEHDETELVVRGSLEEVLSLCGDLVAMERKALRTWAAEQGLSGRRVLAVASRTLRKGESFDSAAERELSFQGLIAFEDVLKSTARETIAKARDLNVAVKIITGDSPEVAGAVAHAVGLVAHPTEVITGKELEALGFEERRLAVMKNAVFARISPHQKYDIIKLLKEQCEVGFLGEGINDAPALKLSNVALVVQGASDIAREAADVVLLQKNLEAVVDGIKEGRIIFANILKYLRVTLTSNFGNFYSVAIASLFLPFVPLLPVQILLLNLLSDFPMIAIATDEVDRDELEKPKNYQMHSIVLMTTLLGVVSSVFDFILFGKFIRVSPEALQTAWFILSVITEVILIFSLRTKFVFYRARHASFSLGLLSFLVLSIVIALPFTFFGREVLHFIEPSLGFFSTILLLAAGYFLATEVVKRFYYRHFSPETILRIPAKKLLMRRTV